MSISKIVIFANIENERVKETCKDINSFLEGLGKTVFVVALSGTNNDYSLKVPKADLAVSLGGDGTVLTCAVILKGTGIPLMSVNMGSFGYITDVQISEFREVFNSFEKGEIGIQKRMMLHAEIKREGNTVDELTALNDITVTASSRLKLAHLNLYINGILGGNFRSDGLIIATPTGSTAYSLSAGGPILEPSMSSIIINPVCPFSMKARPLIVSDNSVIEIQILKEKTAMIVSSDGHKFNDLLEGDVVSVRRCEIDSIFVENRKRSFIEVLRDKLGWAGGFNA